MTVLISWTLALNVASCSAHTSASGSTDATVPAIVSTTPGVAAPIGETIETDDEGSVIQLQALINRRQHDHFDTDYPVGPGDVLEISVPDMPELRSRVVRVSGVNTISLPILGELDVAGLNQSQVKSKIGERLTQYVHDPQVDVFVREYHSREVAVMGMVQKPGTYTLDGPDETVFDVIGKAGGSTDRAANKVILIPSSVSGAGTKALGPNAQGRPFSAPEEQSKVDGSATADGEVKPMQPNKAVQVAEAGAAPRHLAALDDQVPRQAGIAISLSAASTPALLALPARPGDLLIVPAAGEVMVQGWVRNPGAFNITPGMTALGAITAAGGEMFSSSVDVLRTEHGHEQNDYQLDLGKIKNHQARDVFVQSGDIVIVNRTVAGAIPYMAYSLFNKVGAGIYGAPF
jgi:protein involved in polysaccharide export with SLBB domain